jgi:hypothetical protein
MPSQSVRSGWRVHARTLSSIVPYPAVRSTSSVQWAARSTTSGAIKVDEQIIVESRTECPWYENVPRIRSTPVIG